MKFQEELDRVKCIQEQLDEAQNELMFVVESVAFKMVQEKDIDGLEKLQTNFLCVAPVLWAYLGDTIRILKGEYDVT